LLSLTFKKEEEEEEEEEEVAGHKAQC